MNQDVLEIEYYCDHEGDHRTPISECVTSKMKSFKKSEAEAITKFIEEATNIINLDKVLSEFIKEVPASKDNDVFKSNKQTNF